MNPCPICQAPLSEDATAGGTASLGVCINCFNPLLVEWRGSAIFAQPLPNAPDIRHIAPSGSIGAELLAQSVTGLEDLPVLPEMSQRILRLLKDPEFNIAQLAAMIKEDPVIALAIMKQANSAASVGSTRSGTSTRPAPASACERSPIPCNWWPTATCSSPAMPC